VLFCFEENGERLIIKPNNTAKHSLNRMPAPLKPSPPFAPQMPPLPKGRLIPYPHLAGTQTALPSVPVPTKVSFAVVPTPFLDSKTFFLGKKVLACFRQFRERNCGNISFHEKRKLEKKYILILSFSNLMISRNENPNPETKKMKKKRTAFPYGSLDFENK